MADVRAVIFDLDDTLIRSKIDYKKMKSTIIKFLVEVGVEPGLLSENMLNSELIKVAVEDLRKKEKSENTIRKVISKVNEIMNRFELESINDAKLMEGALEVLGYLKSRGIKIGIITNGCRNYAMSIAKKFSLDKYVDAIVARDEVSDPKPNPKHLRVMLKILGVSAEETIFVGDHWIDASCARGAAVKFVLLKSGDKRWRFRDVNCMKFVIIEDLRDLLNLL